MGKRLPQVNPYEDEKGRKYFFDNAKYLLITLVVIAHFISPLKDIENSDTVLRAVVCRAIWVVLNTLHMPALIFISGFFAKSYMEKNGEIKVQRPVTYIILYLASQLAVALFEKLININDPKLSIFYARESLWFLQCLAAWYLLLPILDKFKPLWVMTGSFAFGLLIGYDSEVGLVASLSRMFVFLPFFMAGYYCTQENINKLFSKKIKIAGIAVIVAICAIAFFTATDIDTKVITNSYKYIEIPGVRDWPFVLRWGSRALFYIAAILLGISFLAWVPRKKTFFTKLGSRTLQVYILHRFIYLTEKKFGWWELFDSELGLVLMIIVAIVVTYILSLKVFSYPFDLLQKIKINKFLRKE